MNINLTDQEVLEVQFSLYRNIKYHQKQIKDAKKMIGRKKHYTDKQLELIEHSIESHDQEIKVLESALKKLGG